MPEWCTSIPVLVAMAVFCMADGGFAFVYVCVHVLVHSCIHAPTQAMELCAGESSWGRTSDPEEDCPGITERGHRT